MAQGFTGERLVNLHTLSRKSAEHYAIWQKHANQRTNIPINKPCIKHQVN